MQDLDLIEEKSQDYSSSRNPINRKTRATVLSNNNIPVAQVEKPSYYKQQLVIKNDPQDFLSLPSYRMLSCQITYHFYQMTTAWQLYSCIVSLLYTASLQFVLCITGPQRAIKPLLKGFFIRLVKILQRNVRASNYSS